MRQTPVRTHLFNIVAGASLLVAGLNFLIAPHSLASNSNSKQVTGKVANLEQCLTRTSHGTAIALAPPNNDTSADDAVSADEARMIQIYKNANQAVVHITAV